MKLILLRHGETELNRKGLVQGWSDSSLTENAVEMTRKAGRYLKSEQVEHIYCSTLHRTLETAEIICDELGKNNHEITQMDELCEYNYGVFEQGPQEDMKFAILQYLSKHTNIKEKYQMLFRNSSSRNNRILWMQLLRLTVNQGWMQVSTCLIPKNLSSIYRI